VKYCIIRIIRVRRGTKQLTRAELMHNGLEAESPADALRQYKAQGGYGNVQDLEAMET
jgi:hypothetical protein